MEKEKEFKGKCMGVRLLQRSPKDRHILFQLLVEDDENWYDKGTPVSSYWLDEMIEVLQEAKAYCKRQKKDPEGFGYAFKG